MSGNGQGRPPRPRIEIDAPGASPQQAAAIAAALEQFLADTAPPARSPGHPANPWQRAALREGIGARQGSAHPWGEGSGWLA